MPRKNQRKVKGLNPDQAPGRQEKPSKDHVVRFSHRYQFNAAYAPTFMTRPFAYNHVVRFSHRYQLNTAHTLIIMSCGLVTGINLCRPCAHHHVVRFCRLIGTNLTQCMCLSLCSAVHSQIELHNLIYRYALIIILGGSHRY